MLVSFHEAISDGTTSQRSRTLPTPYWCSFLWKWQTELGSRRRRVHIIRMATHLLWFHREWRDQTAQGLWCSYEQNVDIIPLPKPAIRTFIGVVQFHNCSCIFKADNGETYDQSPNSNIVSWQQGMFSNSQNSYLTYACMYIYIYTNIWNHKSPNILIYNVDSPTGRCISVKSLVFLRVEDRKKYIKVYIKYTYKWL